MILRMTKIIKILKTKMIEMKKKLMIKTISTHNILIIIDSSIKCDKICDRKISWILISWIIITRNNRVYID